MSSSDLPKLWTEPTKIGHIFRKYSILKKSKFSKTFPLKGVPSPTFFKERKLDRFDQFL